MLQLEDSGSVPVAFIFPSAFIAPFEGGPASKLRGLPCLSCGVAGSGGLSADGGGQGGEIFGESCASFRGRGSDDSDPPRAVKEGARLSIPVPTLFPEQLNLFFLDAAGGRLQGVRGDSFLPSFLPSLATLPLEPCSP